VKLYRATGCWLWLHVSHEWRGADTHVMSGFRRKSEGRERRKHDLCVVV
jgi:hypothetical protein